VKAKRIIGIGLIGIGSSVWVFGGLIGLVSMSSIWPLIISLGIGALLVSAGSWLKGEVQLLADSGDPIAKKPALIEGADNPLHQALKVVRPKSPQEANGEPLSVRMTLGTP